MVCQFLLYNKVNQLYVYIYPHIPSLLHLPPPSLSHPSRWSQSTEMISLCYVAAISSSFTRLKLQRAGTTFCFKLFKKVFIGVQLIYNVALVSSVQQSESVIHIHISLFFRFFSHIGHYRVLSRVPCAIQQVLISYLFYIQQCVYVHPNLPIYPPIPS